MPRPKQQPNLLRAQRALARLVEAAPPRDDADEPAAPSRRGAKGKKSKISRKEQRKKTRVQKKKASALHFSKRTTAAGPATAGKSKAKAASTTQPTDARLPSSTTLATHTNLDAGAESRKRKREKGGDATDVNAATAEPGRHDGSNPLFHSLLREQGLVASAPGDRRGPGAAVDDEDPDDKEIRRLRKLLRMKGGDDMLKDEGDGLEFILGFEEDAAEAALAAGVTLAPTLQGEEGESEDADDFDDVDEVDPVGMLLESEEEDVSDGDEIDLDLDSLMARIDGGGSSTDSDDESRAAPDTDGDDDVDDNDDDDDGDGDDGSQSDSEDGESGDDGDLAPAMFISRAEAYGDQAAGPTENAQRLASVSKYVPPSQRRAQAGPDETARVAHRQIKGLMNKMNEDNFISILRELEEVFARNGRGEVVGIVTTFVLDACMNRAATLRHLLMVYAACVAGLHHTVGMEVTAHFVHAVAIQYEDHYKKLSAAKAATDKDDDGGAAAADAAVEKQCANLAAVLAYLYCCRAVHSTIMMDILKRHLDNFNDADVELILVILQAAGHRLRSDDPEGLKQLFHAVTAKAGATGSMKPRVRFMVDAIADLDRKRMKIVKDTSTALVTLQKATRSYAQSRKHPVREPLRVPWADLLDADTTGRWWLVGSAWAGRSSNPDAGTVLGAGAAGTSATDVDGSHPTDALVEAARRQRMNTDTRRKVFYVIMGSEDYLDAFEKLSRLSLPAKQDREVIRVLVECFLQSRAYNPYFAVLATQLCKHDHNHKFTLQYTLWDRFKTLEDFTVAQASLLARFVAHLIAHFALSVAILKVVEFNSLKGHSLVFFQLLFVTLLTHYDEATVTAVFGRVSGNRQLSQLRTSMLVFIRHYVKKFELGIGDGGTPAAPVADKTRLLAHRVKLARRCLSRSDHDVA